MSKQSVAIYPGTFDPVTRGHADICHRALKIFDRIIVGVAHNPQKNPFFSIDERLEMLSIEMADCKHVSIQPFSGLLVDFARECGSTIIIRGLRAISDFEFEVQLAGMNRSLAPEVETVFFTAAEKFAFVSSSLVREIARLKGDVSEFIHPEIHRRLIERLSLVEN